MNVPQFLLLFMLGIIQCEEEEVQFTQLSRDLDLDYETASKLAELPLECMHIEYPNKLSQVLHDDSEILPPSALHPTFYGCFDWHSSVHGHWLLAKVGNMFPDSAIFQNITSSFEGQFTEEKIAKEVAYFERKWGKLFERTYGWAWLLKLQVELDKSEMESFQRYGKILKPLSDLIAGLYTDYLPRLSYPIRVGEHSNLAFGLIFALEYARFGGNAKLAEEIRNVSLSFYSDDQNCPLGYEPSGSDFLSPCLEEAELMTLVLDDSDDFTDWLRGFLPKMFSEEFMLEPGEVKDRTDGKLVHLDGLNFSRAWALYNIALKISDAQMRARLIEIGDEHILTSLDYVVGSDYAGSHWLASFLLHALETRFQME